MLPASPITSSTQDCPPASHAQVHRLVASSSSSNAVASCTLLFLPPLALLAMDDNSPPDSPSMPWRPGSSAYPPPAPMLSEDLFPSLLQQSKRDLQKLYDGLSEASYDLSLRDIVEPPFSIDGSSAHSMESIQAEIQPTSELLPVSPRETYKGTTCNQKQQYQNRSHSCRKSDSSKYTTPALPECKLAFSFSYPQRAMVYEQSSPLHTPHQQIISSPAPENSLGFSSLPSLEHLLATPQELPALPLERASHLDNPSSTFLSKKPSFKRSSISAHHTSASKRENMHTERRGELNLRGSFSVAGSSNRVHPSSQCSLCSSYTIFFKSRCTVCGKLYCSNCAKDEMDSVSDGRRCKSTCSSRLGSKRFSRSVGSKCWPLCCNVDILNNPSKCKSG